MPYIVTFEVQVTVDASNEREACDNAVNALPDNMYPLEYPQGASYQPTAEEYASLFPSKIKTNP